MNFQFTNEQEELRQTVRKLANERFAPMATDIDNSYEISNEVVRLIGEAGLYRLFYPQQYGGVGLSIINICIVREELAKVSTHAEGAFAVGGLGSVPLVLFGTEEQKKKYLPSFARGEKFMVFCLTEAAAGSDIGAIKTAAHSDGDYYVLNGTKTYVSEPFWTDYYCVFAKTDPRERTKGLSAFIVEREEKPSIAIQKTKMMMPHDIGNVTFINHRVPKENLLGEEGGGARVALSNLDNFRPSVGAAALGMAQAAYNEAKAFAKERIVFQQPLASFQITQFKLAELATEIQAARLMVYLAAWKKDQNMKATRECSMAKLFATEVAQHVATEAVQIMGGRGVTIGERVELFYRVIKTCSIYEGTSEIQKITIARQVLAEDAFTTLP